MKIENWREKTKHIKIPSYLEEELEGYYQYVKKGDSIMALAQIDNVISNINVAEQEKDLTSEEAWYIRKNIIGVY